MKPVAIKVYDNVYYEIIKKHARNKNVLNMFHAILEVQGNVQYDIEDHIKAILKKETRYL